jgi:DNA-binding NtrC family response regulator
MPADSNPCSEVILGVPAVIHSVTMRKVMELVKRVAQTDASVLITGESGVGKELVARALHEHSLRCHLPWVDINCGALPEHLIESELFGFEKGAFSGAAQTKQGLLELAHQGTLFLDEIGDLDPRVQVKLLRVLDGAPYYRLGGLKKISPNVRIVAATNQDLEKGIEAGRFRNDLYHRLGQVHIHVPALRERPEDIAVLAEFFLYKQNPNARFAASALDELADFSWPGNVRELRNVVVRAAILSNGEEIQPEDLPLSKPKAGSTPVLEPSNLDDMERQMIFRALDQTDGHHARAARVLGISRRTLSRKLKKYEGSNACERAMAG